MTGFGMTGFGMTRLEMRGFRSLALLAAPLLAAAMLTGCAAEPPKQTTTVAPPVVIMPPTPEQSADILTDLTKMNPGARVGHVAGVREDIVAVEGIPVADVPAMASIQFTDGHGKGLASGTVKHSTDAGSPYLIVVDCVPTSDGRMPVKDDIAVYIPR